MEQVIAVHAPAIITKAMRGGNSALNIKKKREGKGASQTDSWVRALPPAC